MSKLSQLNYNQLKVFISIYEHGQCHQAATELDMTASGISRTLKNLRDVFNDCLFIRRGSAFVATEKTQQLIPIAKTLVEQYQKLEMQHSVFTPAKSAGQFIIYAYDEFIYPVLKVIRNDILLEAPNLRFDVRVLTDDCSTELANGDVDFVVGYEGFNSKNLKYEMFAGTYSPYIFVRAGHPLIKQKLTLKNISRYAYLEIDKYNDISNPLLVNLCREQGLSMDIEGYTDSLASAMRLISETNAITLSCNQFTRQFGSMIPKIQCLKLPENLAQKYRTRRREHRDIGNYVLFGNTNNSSIFKWLKSKLIDGLEKE